MRGHGFARAPDDLVGLRATRLDGLGDLVAATKQVQRVLGVLSAAREPGPREVEEFGVQATELEPNQGGTNRAELLSLLADQGTNLIIGVGFLFAETIRRISDGESVTSLFSEQNNNF